MPVPRAELPPTLRVDERNALTEYAALVRRRFGERVRDLRLFGSRARGEGHEDSDLDVLVVVDGLTPEERREVWGWSGDLMLAHEVMIGGLATSAADWQELRDRERLIVREIDRDGMPL